MTYILNILVFSIVYLICKTRRRQHNKQQIKKKIKVHEFIESHDKKANKYTTH